MEGDDMSTQATQATQASPAAPAGSTIEGEDEALEIRYSLTALGEAIASERRGRLFRGFGPCTMAAVA